MTVLVEVQPPEIPMQLQVRQPGEDIISNISFNNRTSATFTPITNGEYTIIIANLGNEQASVNMLAGTNPFFALDGDDGNQAAGQCCTWSNVNIWANIRRYWICCDCYRCNSVFL